MPKLRVFVELDELARQMAVSTCQGSSFEYEHELDALVDFVRLLDEHIGDSEFTLRLHKLTTTLVEDIGYHENRHLD